MAASFGLIPQPDDAPQTPEELRQDWVDCEVAQWFPDLDRHRGPYSEYRRTLDEISKAALAHAREAGLVGADRGWYALEQLLDRAFDVVRTLHYALEPVHEAEEEKQKLKLWSHRSHALNDVVANKTPHFSRPEIEQAVGQYLALPFRAGPMDRLLADLLVALELYQFADEMINEIVIPELGAARSPYKQQHPLRRYLKGLGYTLSVATTIWAAAFGLNQWAVINHSWAMAGYIAGVSIGLFDFILLTAYLPSFWSKHTRSIKRANALVSEMLACYRELQSSGPISARRLFERLKEAADKGVAWPGPLYALLDDVMARTGRL